MSETEGNCIMLLLMLIYWALSRRIGRAEKRIEKLETDPTSGDAAETEK